LQLAALFEFSWRLLWRSFAFFAVKFLTFTTGKYFSFPPFALMQKVEFRLRFASDGQAKNQGRPDRSAQPSVPPHNSHSGPVS
jgi:hypothetical protein